MRSKIITIIFVSFFCFVGCSSDKNSVKNMLNSLQCNGTGKINFNLSNNEMISTIDGQKYTSKYKILKDTDNLFVIRMESFNKSVQDSPDEITYERKQDGKIWRTLKTDSHWKTATTEEPRECWPIKN